MTRDPILITVLARVGGCSALARRLHIGPTAVNNWRRVPAAWLPRVSIITGIAPYEIRPDLYDMAALNRPRRSADARQ